MKLSIKNIAILASLITICCMAACKKKDDNTNAAPATPKGILYFHIHTDIDTSEVDSAQIAMDASGRHFQLDTACFYISGIVLHKADGSNYTLNNTYILKTMGEEQYMADSVPAGNYTSVSFNVGLDAAANAKDPSSYSSGSVLSPQVPSMWFGSVSQGYIFMYIAGLADTSAAQASGLTWHFSYRIGTSSMLKTVNLPAKTFSVIANQSSFVHLNADYGKVLSGVNFATNNTATPFVNSSIASRIAANITNMFSYEE